MQQLIKITMKATWVGKDTRERIVYGSKKKQEKTAEGKKKEEEEREERTTQKQQKWQELVDSNRR